VLLDAVMPGIDGFEVARRLKADTDTAPIPIVFMTGLTETEHVVAAFGAGGTDYVTKPIRRARCWRASPPTCTRRARSARRATRSTPSATRRWWCASATAAASGRPRSRAAAAEHFGGDDVEHAAGADRLGRARGAAAARRCRAGDADGGARRRAASLSRCTRCRGHFDDAGGGEWLIVMRESDDAAIVDAVALALELTAREAEVLYWVVKGKTNRDIGDILGTSPRTVTKHLEHIFEKLGVETRTAAAAVAMARVRELAAAEPRVVPRFPAPSQRARRRPRGRCYPRAPDLRRPPAFRAART
jgi:DNA-binding NarL/FixJ family response regulator